MTENAKDTTFTVTDGIGEFTLNRPDVLNALTEDMVRELRGMIDRVQGNNEVRALIISGEGRAFSAGGNVKGMSERQQDNKPDTTKPRDRILELHDWLERLYNLDCPVIAAVDGLAFGGGFSLALACDFVFATERSRFSAVFGRIGLVPDMALVYTLPRLVGMAQAKDILYTARSVSAEEALDLGIVHSLHAPDELMPAARRYAGRLAKGSKSAIAATKRMTNKAFQSNYKDVAEWEADAQSLMFTTDFNREAVRRFIAKEPALYNWDEMADD